MNRILDFIEKYKFAIVGTVVFHICFFMYANFHTIHRPYKLVEPVTEVSIPLDDIPLDPELMKLLEIPQDAPGGEVYNVTSDANDTREKSYDDFSTYEIDQKVTEDARALEQQYKDYWAGTHKDEPKNDPSIDINDKKDDSKVNPTNNPNGSIDSDGKNAFAGDVMASYNLKDRKAHSLEKPGYTCNSSGTVVLQIRVDKNGDVDDVTYVESGSVNATECMITQSIKYAKRSRFNYSETAPAVQTGTITYKFVTK
jgi:hypothetical protein